MSLHLISFVQTEPCKAQKGVTTVTQSQQVLVSTPEAEFQQQVRNAQACCSHHCDRGVLWIYDARAGRKVLEICPHVYALPPVPRTPPTLPGWTSRA